GLVGGRHGHDARDQPHVVGGRRRRGLHVGVLGDRRGRGRVRRRDGHGEGAARCGGRSHPVAQGGLAWRAVARWTRGLRTGHVENGALVRFPAAGGAVPSHDLPSGPRDPCGLSGVSARRGAGTRLGPRHTIADRSRTEGDPSPCVSQQPRKVPPPAPRLNEMWTWSKWFAVAPPRSSIRFQPLPWLIRWRQITYLMPRASMFSNAHAARRSPVARSTMKSTARPPGWSEVPARPATPCIVGSPN